MAVHANFISLPRPLPLGEVDANVVSRRRGRGCFPQCRRFRRKQALQMPLAAATSSVKKQFRNARRRFETAIIKYNFRLFARQQHRQHGFLDVETVLRFVKDLVRVLLEQGGGDLLAPVGGQTVQHQRARLCVF